MSRLDCVVVVSDERLIPGEAARYYYSTYSELQEG
jgi:hypothetical protein